MNEYGLFKYLVKHTSLQNQEIIDLIAMSECIHLRKSTEWSGPANRSFEIGFITKGVLGLFVKNRPSKIIGIEAEENWISFDSSDGITNSSVDESENFEAKYEYRAIEETFIYCFSKSSLNQIVYSYPIFQKILITIYRQTYLKSLNQLSQLYTLDAENRYKNWIITNPSLTQRLPQYLLASYLGIIPSSLSRIRKQVVKK